MKEEYLKRTPKYRIDKIILDVINKGLKKVTIPDLQKASRISLLNFYYRQYAEISRINGNMLIIALACIKIADKSTKLVEMPLSRAESIVKDLIPSTYDEVKEYGVPLQKYSKDYIEKNVKPVFDRLCKQYPFDPNSVPKKDRLSATQKHINSLRNRAEMEVRYNGHLENIQELKEQGNKLVIASTHADCSERCSKWQGRVYSLDGTSGTTPDGRKYIPLETATDVYYTTKAGKVYKNGLLGFNCRHYLVAYKDGFRFSRPNPAEERKDYKITENQRYLERQVRKWRDTALYYKGVDKKRYQKAKQKAERYNQEYIRYSHENGRAYYPSRTKIL